MLKYMKHEFLHSYRTYFTAFAVFFAICVGIPFINQVLLNIDSYDYIGSFLLFSSYIAIYGMVVALFIGIIYTFNQTMFKRPGYLTLTLPLKTYQIVLSKMFASALWLIVAYFVLLLSLYLTSIISSILSGTMVWSWDEIPVISTALYIYRSGTFLQCVMNALEIGSLIISGLFITVSYFYTIVTFVHTQYVKKHKLAIGFIIFVFTFYIGCDMAIYLVSHFQSSLVFIAFCLFFTTIFTFITVYLIDHKIELE